MGRDHRWDSEVRNFNFQNRKYPGHHETSVYTHIVYVVQMDSLCVLWAWRKKRAFLGSRIVDQPKTTEGTSARSARASLLDLSSAPTSPKP